MFALVLLGQALLQANPGLIVKLNFFLART